MQMSQLGVQIAENVDLPDFLVRQGMRRLLAQWEAIAVGDHADEEFAAQMARRPVAEYSERANAQHYELPAVFFQAFLGPARKYSSCFYETGRETLAEAEELALEQTVKHADIVDGQSILELGCGWGSLTLWIAKRLPSCTITAVSNSRSQGAYIRMRAQQLGLANITVISADMNEFEPDARFDRVISVEMFEHIANWRALLSRIHRWVEPDGFVFLHIFAHRRRCALYDLRDENDWIAQHFFTGGIMPSQTLIHQFADIFAVSEHWRWSGSHYQRTAEQWLKAFDAHKRDIDPILRDIYGDEAALWRRRWRMFFLAVAEMFGFGSGEHWGVSHYRLRPNPNFGV